jgi:hypothetical protein
MRTEVSSVRAIHSIAQSLFNEVTIYLQMYVATDMRIRCKDIVNIKHSFLFSPRDHCIWHDQVKQSANFKAIQINTALSRKTFSFHASNFCE